MNFLDIVKNRQSVRTYDSKPVEREKIERCIEAARLAPSACNAQPWHFIIVDDPELKQEIGKFAKNKLLKLNLFSDQPPVFVVLVTESANFTSKLGGIVKGKQYSLIDTGIAAQHFCIQAFEEGLGTCMMGWFDEQAVKKVLDIPKNKRVNLIISIGYPSKENKIRKKVRKKIKEIMTYNKYR